ncbi:hypothetical protein [Marinibactrum halimedae]|uniref:hypothetical protein n=1 Tax=Marinibactrum halimedae TaxID=1444977 RepID=UPI0024E16E10|nr:hypothetical protein [Marinibactrum halimedae]
MTLVLGAVSAFADDRNPEAKHRLNPERHTQYLTEKLALDTQQQEQVRAILEGSHARVESILENHRPTRDNVRTELKAVRKDTDIQLASVLTLEQMEKMQALRKVHREHRRERAVKRRHHTENTHDEAEY